MPHPDHDAIVRAFSAIPGVRTCDRGDPNTGYTHIHGPKSKRGTKRCRKHSVAVEKVNGTVVPCRAIATALPGAASYGMATKRPKTPIGTGAPLGYSFRRQYGRFEYAFPASVVLQNQQTLQQFVRDVVALAIQNKIW